MQKLNQKRIGFVGILYVKNQGVNYGEKDTGSERDSTGYL